ncbi:MAG TPA: IS110 family transposase [Terriglobales bacterium]|nr:IS110 family transposase [Terriglobales bacterium]
MNFCGIDVSAHELVVALRSAHHDLPQQTFPNTASGHRCLLAWLRRHGSPLRVSLEASGVYSLDLALFLAQSAELELAVVNPNLIRRFAESLDERSKDDPLDARVLLEYTARMPFRGWLPPSPTLLAVRDITRHLLATTELRTATRNRLHAARSTRSTPACVRHELERSLRQIEASRLRLQRQARALVAQDPTLEPQFQLLLTVPGIAQLSALQVLAEVGMLGDRKVRQWVKHAGLDVRHYSSGSSVRRLPHLSKCGNRYLRRALFMPALVASRFDPSLRAFYQHLLARGKRKRQALAARMRQLLHAIFGMFRHLQPYQGELLCPVLPQAA